ncbi:sulfite exporter TauE/SafE family protein [Glycomyces sp. TRM65418]|uniref:sulfite exporter TauE/SafE family protein n=1 Tax=Glycomyces sp. TRM65418 TaxID=2867006 RepID=UPI001CE5D3F2|nr:sulfite exporter TauE/SafE family protein [Glycomyces sp. TRM65418]MCC3765189.1 sulfite exporter TauE/SafE family protein [Glycomyces sp. TRM65418]QZD54814.1 sulfite exporter TauE/SafE family protein [Glycomyces sp. TRM65418]
MNLIEVSALLLAGLVGGGLNAVAGGGSLITYPTLMAVGVPALQANATNGIAVAPAYAAAAAGSRENLRGQRRRALGLIPTALVASVCGALLLLNTPHEVFEAIVPFLVLAATLLMAVGPWVNRKVTALNGGRDLHPVVLHVGVFAGCLYGSYFNAALGLILMAVIAMGVSEALGRVGALKNFCTMLVGLVTCFMYGVWADVAWWAIGVLVPATFLGGYIGARVFQKIPERPLRIAIVVYGLVLSAILLVRSL